MKKIVRWLILAGGIILLLCLGFMIYKSWTVKATLKTSVVAITAQNQKTYTAGQKILTDDFEVLEKHENGKSIRLHSKEFTIQPDMAAETGDVTSVTITKVSDPSVTCTVDVKNQRVEVASFDVGYPNLTDVKATLYSNGELAFTGSGNVKNFEKKKMPWTTFEDARNHPIVSVVFEDGVMPVSMDYWFTGQKELKNIDVIPSSVQSMEDTFAECTALKTGPDWSRCESLTNLKGTLSKDTSLTYVYPIPSGVTVLDEICNGCTSLEVAPDMSGAAGVLYMQASFAGCVSLYDVSLPINVQNLSNTFSGCLNLETAPEIPATVVSMNNTFKKCSALKHASKIPSGVTDLSNTYAECPKLCGTLEIDANPEKYNGFLSKSVVSVSLNLTGASPVLDLLGLTKDETADITVNGNIPTKNGA